MSAFSDGAPELVIGSFPKNGYIKPLLLPLPVIKSNGRKARVVCFERRPRPAGSRGNRKLKDKTGLLACQKRHVKKDSGHPARFR
jgi:hypothetical protein